MANELIPYCRGDEVSFKEPEVDPRSYDRTVKAISNAWKNGVIIDDIGAMWIQSDKVHTILRTKPEIARYILSKIDDKYKRTYNSKIYIKSHEVVYEIIKEREKASSCGTKGIYLKISNDYYEEMQNSDIVKLKKAEYDAYMVASRKKLKGGRKRVYKICKDELTNKKLKRNSQFSHIRSVAIYKELVNSIDNGLLVNEDTHSIITKNGIQDEEQLFDLCQLNGWNTDWYERFKENIKNK